MSSKKLRTDFIKNLLNDLSAMEHMLNNDWFENDIVRIGAEQEIVLIDKHSMKPKMVGPEIKESHSDEPWLVGELARFNLELNLEPRVFSGDCFKLMENELIENLGKVRKFAAKYDADYLLTGILPTLKKYHLNFENLTPHPRYFALMQALKDDLKEQEFELRLTGIDELLVKHDSPLLEACNTSYQVHLQVAPKDFVKYYNYALALTAPCIAMAANSPIVFGKRLWHESRIALFQQAIDTRKTYDHMRQMSPRVILGEKWLENDITEIFKDDLVRFRVLLPEEVEENSLEKISNNIVPKLKSLQRHNSTVYRWNRPCYGISDTGKPHLRIENRIFPAGPTILDEIANSAFWLGAMKGMDTAYDNICDEMSFDDIRDNFGKAARYGIDSKFTWTKDKKITAKDLLQEVLLPIARAGLQKMQVSSDSIDRYLGVIEERMDKHMNGARWLLRSYTRLAHECASQDEALTNLTAAIHRNQNLPDHPGHNWREPVLEDLKEYRPQDIRVSEFMETELITSQKSDLAELVVKLMTWKDISFMPVEDKRGNLVGLIGKDQAQTRIEEENRHQRPKDLLVRDVMLAMPETVGPDDLINIAIDKMNNSPFKCLPVVRKKELVGILTETNLNRIIKRVK